MKKILCLLLVGSCGLVWAQTNLPSIKKSADPQIKIGSDHLTKTELQVIYFGNVWVKDASGKMTCERLLIDVPPKGSSQPTNIVAEGNVVVNAVDEKGETNHITADKAIYTYHVVDAVTNQVINFTNNARFENSKLWQTADSIQYDLQTKKIQCDGNIVTGTKGDLNFGKGTNASPFNLLK